MSSKKQLDKKPYAVVFALDCINGIQTARILAKRGVPVIGIASDPKHPFCQTRVCEKIIITNAGSDDLIKALEALGRTLKEKAVLIPCNNLEVLLVSRHRQHLSNWYQIIMSDPLVDETLMLKVKFYDFAQQRGFSVPRTFTLNNRSDVERAAQMLIFPCILKPSIKSTEWVTNSAAKGYKAFTAEELLCLYDRCAKWGTELVVQEWIEGPDSNLYTCYCYFDVNSEPLVTFVTRKLRQFPPEVGDGCLGQECRNDTVLQETLRFFKSIQLRGFGYLELKYESRTGKYLIVEPNIGRPTNKSALAEASGVELVYTMYCDALGWPLPENRVQKYGNGKWIFLRRDFPSAFYYWRRGELTLYRWWKSLQGIKLEALFSWNDPAPFWYDLIYSVRKYLSPQERRKSNYQDPFPRATALDTNKATMHRN